MVIENKTFMNEWLIELLTQDIHVTHIDKKHGITF